MAQKAHAYSEEMSKVASGLCAFGIPQSDIAQYLGINKRTLTKYYGEDMANAVTGRNAKVAQFLYNAASGAALEHGAQYGDCLRAAMFWAKTRIGWREKQEVEVTGDIGRVERVEIAIVGQDATDKGDEAAS